MMKFYFGNVDYKTTENEMFDKFNECGEVASIKMTVDRETGNFKGFGFVEMVSGAEAVLALNKTIFKGRPIIVREYVDKRKQDRDGDCQPAGVSHIAKPHQDKRKGFKTRRRERSDFNWPEGSYKHARSYSDRSYMNER